jgi:hypothetical protein
MSNEPNLHNFFTISLHFLTSPSSGQGNPNESRRLLKMPCEPNFQKRGLTVTLDKIRTYNESCPKTHKKSKPNPNPIQTLSKPNANPIQTQKKPNQTQFQNPAATNLAIPIMLVIILAVLKNKNVSMKAHCLCR